MNRPEARGKHWLANRIAAAAILGTVTFAPVAVWAAEQFLNIDFHANGGNKDIIGNLHLVFDNADLSKGFTKIAIVTNTTKFYLDPYFGGDTNYKSTGANAPTNSSYPNIPYTCGSNLGTGVCWIGDTTNAPKNGSVLAPSVNGQTGYIKQAGYGSIDYGVTPGTSIGSVEAAKKGGYLVAALHFGFMDSNNNSWWIEGSGEQYDLHSAHYDATTNQYWRISNNENDTGESLINNYALVCADTTNSATNAQTGCGVPEIDGNVLPKGLLLLGSLYMIARRRVVG